MGKIAGWFVVGGVVVGAIVAPGSGAGGSAPPDGRVDYGDPANWVCRPDTDDVCDTGLDATVVAADGTLTVEAFSPDPDAPIDCFYVYPTISRDPTPNSDLVAGPDEEQYVTVNQVAPLGGTCRVFAPLYRQVTLAALAGTVTAGPAARELAAADVLDAWEHYLANDNHGRGVVVVGHSQGAGILARLLADHVDDDDGARSLLVAAYLAGTSIQVPPGADVGGTFQHLPLCRAADQVGCVVTWSTYRASSPPPPTAFFGASGDGTEAACTNPASLSGGRAELRARFPTDDGAWLHPGAGTIDTPHVVLPGLLTGGCVAWNGLNYLEVATHPDDGPRADDIPGDLSPEWGLHVVDLNVVMGDLQELIVTQATSWMAAHDASALGSAADRDVMSNS